MSDFKRCGGAHPPAKKRDADGCHSGTERSANENTLMMIVGTDQSRVE